MARILIINDKVVCDAMSVFLIRDGHKVLTAGDRVTGFQMLRTMSPDLVIVDRDLPGMSGKGGLEHLDKMCGAAPVVVISGRNCGEEADACLRCGAAAFLRKNEGLSPVLEEVDRLLGMKKAAAEAAQGSPGGGRPLVLVVDDEEEICRVLRRYLSSAGFEVLTAPDGLSAEALARSHKPDIVLLDIFMPGKSGVEVLETLKREFPHTGFIMITGNDEEQLARECLRAGAFEYVSKPINLEALSHVIKARLIQQQY